MENGYLYPETAEELSPPAPDDDYNDPDWMPTTVLEPYPTYNPHQTAKTQTQRQRTSAKFSSKLNQNTSSVLISDNIKPASKRASKKRNSSTTEIELQIEIEASTKRAKVGYYSQQYNISIFLLLITKLNPPHKMNHLKLGRNS